MKTADIISSQQRVSIEQITPIIADQILQDQEARIASGEYSQRNLNEATVHKYATEMKAGHWMLNNQGIGFDVDGNLLDGRHRLWAIKKSGITVPIMVMRGIPSISKNGILIKAVDTIDCGRQRPLSQQLQIDGVKNACVTAAAVRAITLIACDFRSNMKTSVIQVRCVLALVEPSIVRIFQNIGVTRLARGSLLGPLAMYHQLKPKKADDFSQSYSDMVGLKEGSPVIALQKYFRVNTAASGGRTTNGIRATALAIMHYDEGNSINAIRHGNSGADWLASESKTLVEKVRKIMGV